MEFVDYGIIGEGEYTVSELADALEKGNIPEVAGLIYKENGQYIKTSPRKPIEDLDSLPYPDYEGLEYATLLDKTSFDIWAGEKERVGYISLSRSCPFSCTFCFHPVGSKYRRRKMESVFKEIDYLIERFKVNFLSIEDELFVVNKDDLIEFCREVKKRNIEFAAQLRVDMVNEESLSALKDAGCISVSFGLESADNRILKSMKKKITVEQIETALSICHRLGINIVGNFIFGDREETVESYNNTLKWWREHPQYPIYLHPIIVYPGSELYQYACAEGIIKDRAEFIRNGCPHINVSKLTDEEYREMIFVTSMALKPSEEIYDAKVTYTGSNKATIEGKCPRCRAHNEWKGMDVFRNLGLVTCSECGKSLYLIPSYYIGDIAKNNFAKLDNSKVAFWPMINAVGEIVNCVPAIAESNNVFFVDKSPAKNKMKYEGKAVEYPSVIEEEKEDTVFITSSAPFLVMEIIQEIRKKYPTVKRVYFAGDLIAPDFGEKYNLL